MQKLIINVLIGFCILACQPSHFSKEANMENSKKNTGIVELTTFELKEGVSNEVFLESAQKMQKEFLSTQEGFIKRTLVQSEDGTWTDIVYWEKHESCELAMKAAENAPSALPFMQQIVFESVKMNFSTPHLIIE